MILKRYRKKVHFMVSGNFEAFRNKAKIFEQFRTISEDLRNGSELFRESWITARHKTSYDNGLVTTDSH
jgi:hypothetical protein